MLPSLKEMAFLSLANAVFDLQNPPPGCTDRTLACHLTTLLPQLLLLEVSVAGDALLFLSAGSRILP